MAHLHHARWTNRQRGETMVDAVVRHLLILAVGVAVAGPLANAAVAGSMAAVSGGRGYGRQAGYATAASSAAGYPNGFLPPFPQTPAGQAPPPPPPAASFNVQSAEKKRQRQLKSLLTKLNRMESRRARSLDECQKWANLNDRYIRLVGAERDVRPAEVVKQQECALLGLNVGAEPPSIAEMPADRVDQLREALDAERDQLQTASNLIADYTDVRAAIASGNHAVEQRFNELRDTDDQFNYLVNRLDSFIKYLDSRVVQLVGVAPNLEDVDQVERAARVLIDRENELTDDDSNRLLELSDNLERHLNDASSPIDPQSGRWRYLFGTMEAAREVVLRKVRGEEPPAPPVLAHPAPAGASFGAAAVAGAGHRAAVAGSAAGVRGGLASATSSAAVATDYDDYDEPEQAAYDPRDQEAVQAEARALEEANAAQAAEEARRRAADARAAARAKRSNARAAAAARAQSNNGGGAASAAAASSAPGLVRSQAPQQQQAPQQYQQYQPQHFQQPAPQQQPRRGGATAVALAAATSGNGNQFVQLPTQIRRRFVDYQ